MSLVLKNKLFDLTSLFHDINRLGVKTLDVFFQNRTLLRAPRGRDEKRILTS